ncbi:MAG: IS200/IS605 family transposase [Dehalococcoidales bacterium]|nr:IS200/IS605 family transposase [Dehalococcoidales bacterium]
MVLVTKYRREVFNEGTFAYVEKKLAEISEHYPLIQIEVANQDRDHIQMMVSIPPTMAVDKAIGIIKQNTAKEMKQKFPFLKQVYWGNEGVWSDGYFVSTVGINAEVIKVYVER